MQLAHTQGLRGFPTILYVVAATSAAVGGILWIAKGLAILVGDKQPDYTFEVAPFFFGIGVAGVAYRWSRSRDEMGLLLRCLVAIAVLGGAATALTYIAFGDSDLFGLCIMVALLAVLGVLLTVGRNARQTSAIPGLLGLLMIASIPIGGALAEIDERLLELPLVAVGLGWLVLAIAIVKAGELHAAIPTSSVEPART